MGAWFLLVIYLLIFPIRAVLCPIGAVVTWVIVILGFIPSTYLFIANAQESIRQTAPLSIRTRSLEHYVQLDI